MRRPDFRRAGPRPAAPAQPAFTLIELLVVVAIIAVLVSILLPALSTARARASGVRCLTNLHSLAQGAALYNLENRDMMMPCRLPGVDDCTWSYRLPGGRKYRPTFLSMMSTAINVPPFDEPLSCRGQKDRHGQDSDRQDFSYPVYYCPSVPSWIDERNSSYGYNYHFLGNARLLNSKDITSYKNWPVTVTSVRRTSGTVMMVDSLGTAASFPPGQRIPYENNSRDWNRVGNEGYNLDPPRLDPLKGEIDEKPNYRTSPDPRHSGKTNIAWLDGHASSMTLAQLGYRDNPDGSIGFEGENSLWTGDGRDVPWLPGFRQTSGPGK